MPKKLKITKKAREALKQSLQKWENIVEGTEIDRGPYNCPLCEVFWATYNCNGCPVSKDTGQLCCVGTPYDAWEDHHTLRIKSLKISRHHTKRLALAQAEADYLKDLLVRTA